MSENIRSPSLCKTQAAWAKRARPSRSMCSAAPFKVNDFMWFVGKSTNLAAKKPRRTLSQQEPFKMQIAVPLR